MDNSKKHKAKMEAIKKMRKVMGELGGRSIMDGLSKGAVAAKVIAKDPESLKEGLKKAADVVEEQEEMMHDDHDMEEAGEYEDLSKEELIKLLKKRS